MERESSLSPAAEAGPDLGLAAPVANPAEPPVDDDEPRAVAQGTARGPMLRLFVVHAPEDAWFVDGFLLEALNLSEGEVLVSSRLEPGAVIVNEIERGALSPVTVVVVSPAFLASPWAQFANQLAIHQSIEAANDGNATLIPVILADCELPPLSRFRVPLDFRNRERRHWEAEAEKLRRKLAVQAPVVAPAVTVARRDSGALSSRLRSRTEPVRRLCSRLVPRSALPLMRAPWAVALVMVAASGLAAWHWWPAPAPRSWGFWRVQVDLPGDCFVRGLPLDLKVRADHAGYVWIFSPDHAQPVLAWPHPDDERLALNTIEADTWRPIPLLGHDHYGIAAAASGTSTTNATEELILIVTAEPEREVALRHLAAMRPELEIKATVLAAGDWGASTRSYQVTAP